MIATLPTRTLGTDGPLVSTIGRCCTGLSANGSAFLIDGGVTASYFYGALQP